MRPYKVSNAIRVLGVVTIGLFALISSDDAQAARRTKQKRMIIEGVIQQISADAVVLNNTRVQLTPRTVYQDFQDNRISLSAFVAGDCVKVKLVAGRLEKTAREMEFESSCPAANGSVGARPTPTSTPAPNGAIDDKGNRSAGNVNDDCDSNKNDDRGGQRRGRGRGRDDR
jgi:hypothetical protein